MPVFPSIEWFNEVRDIVNEDPQFRSLGTNDTKFGVIAGDALYQVAIDGFECASINEINQDDLGDLDFYIDMPIERWRELVENIKANAGADSNHTLNTLDLTEPEGIIKTHNELGRLSFLKYHLSLQAFFDASSKIETTFA